MNCRMKNALNTLPLSCMSADARGRDWGDVWRIRIWNSHDRGGVLTSCYCHADTIYFSFTVLFSNVILIIVIH